ncbi:unnamed protein product [marine sediment metagenome]|uniref:Uncharacterized protein n=1 Tax=marine sediment metagenome TaxID=412755 RepID=X1LNI9_9ZZZZ
MGINVEVVGKVGGCLLKAVTTEDGKTHFESDCLDKEARDKLNAIFEEEAVLRVTPKAFIEEIPGIEPAAPVTES